jgi:hypothetical protein
VAVVGSVLAVPVLPGPPDVALVVVVICPEVVVTGCPLESVAPVVCPPVLVVPPGASAPGPVVEVAPVSGAPAGDVVDVVF